MTEFLGVKSSDSKFDMLLNLDAISHADFYMDNEHQKVNVFMLGGNEGHAQLGLAGDSAEALLWALNRKRLGG